MGSTSTETVMSSPVPESGPWSEFRGDLVSALRAWQVAPLLPVIALLISASTFVPQPWWWGVVPIMLYALGWLGAERIWYLRIFRKEPIAPRELLRLTSAYFGRYLRLALLLTLFGLPLIVLIVGPDHDPRRTPVWLTYAVLMVVADVVLTFVTPALAFSTPSVRQSFRIGLRMLREHWPHCIWYAAVPPLAVVLFARINEPSTPGWGPEVIASFGAALLNLWFKGATASFYLRRVSVGRDGAAFSSLSDARTDPVG